MMMSWYSMSSSAMYLSLQQHFFFAFFRHFLCCLQLQPYPPPSKKNLCDAICKSRCPMRCYLIFPINANLVKSYRTFLPRILEVFTRTEDKPRIAAIFTAV